MLRPVMGGTLVLALVAGLAPAENKKPAGLAGTVKKVDAKKSLLIGTVKGTDREAQDKYVEVKITDQTRFVAGMGGGARKEFKGKDGLKDDAFKAGSRVMIMLDAKGDARTVMTMPTAYGPPDGTGLGRPS